MTVRKRTYLTRIREMDGVMRVEVFDPNADNERTATVALLACACGVDVADMLRQMLRTMTVKQARRVRYPALRSVTSKREPPGTPCDS